MNLFFDVFQSSSMLILAVFLPDHQRINLFYQMNPKIPAPDPDSLTRYLSVMLPGIECKAWQLHENEHSRRLEELLKMREACWIGWQNGADKDFKERVQAVFHRLGIRDLPPVQVFNLTGVSETMSRTDLEKVMASWGASIQYPLPRKRVRAKECQQWIAGFALGACESARFLANLYLHPDVQAGLNKRRALQGFDPSLRLPLQLSAGHMVRRIIAFIAGRSALGTDLPGITFQLPVDDGHGHVHTVHLLDQAAWQWNRYMEGAYPSYSFLPWQAALQALEGASPPPESDILNDMVSQGLPGLLLLDGNKQPIGSYLAMGKGRLAAGCFDCKRYVQDMSEWKKTPGSFTAMCLQVARDQKKAVDMLEVDDFLTSQATITLPSMRSITPLAFIHIDNRKKPVLTAPLPPSPFPKGRKRNKPAGSSFIQPAYLQPVYTHAWKIDTSLLKTEILARLPLFADHPVFFSLVKTIPSSPLESSRNPPKHQAEALIKEHAFSAFSSMENPNLYRPNAVRSALLMEMLLQILLAMECAKANVRPVSLFRKNMYVAGAEAQVQSVLKQFSARYGLPLKASPCFFMTRGGTELAVLDPEIRKIQDFGGSDFSNCKAPGTRINTQPIIVSKTLSYILCVSCRKNEKPNRDLTLDMARNYIRKIMAAVLSMKEKLLLFSIPISAADDCSLCFFQKDDQGTSILNAHNRVFLVKEDCALPVQGQMLQVRISSDGIHRKSETKAADAQKQLLQSALETTGQTIHPDDVLLLRSVYGLPAQANCTVENRDLGTLKDPDALLSALDLDAYARQVRTAYERWKFPSSGDDILIRP